MVADAEFFSSFLYVHLTQPNQQQTSLNRAFFCAFILNSVEDPDASKYLCNQHIFLVCRFLCSLVEQLRIPFGGAAAAVVYFLRSFLGSF